MKVKPKSYLRPALQNPILLCGLPDVAFIGKQSVDFLIQKLEAKLFEEIFSPHFPPHILIKKDGTVELMNNQLYYWKSPQPGKDLVFLTGNTQAISPDGQYELADEILKRAEKFDVEKVLTVTAYVVESRSPVKPKVYAVTTDVELGKELEKYGVQLLDRGSIRGFNGLLLGMAKLRDIPGACLLSEAIDYLTVSGRIIVDVKSVQAALEIVTKILNVQVDLTDIETQIKTTEELIQKLEEAERQALEQIVKPPPTRQIYYI